MPTPEIPTPPPELPPNEHDWNADLEGLLASLEADNCEEVKKLLCCTKAKYGPQYAVELAKHLEGLKQSQDQETKRFLRKQHKERHDYLDAVASALGI